MKVKLHKLALIKTLSHKGSTAEKVAHYQEFDPSASPDTLRKVRELCNESPVKRHEVIRGLIMR